ncbi:homoserine O-succinyltransferase [Neobacillus sp. PS3-34]|uniref:homoserine O-succinyltransferase n=1 Tax=Neobacillus sp. PS3-34 TaxID=3070678 RepID=UPI0027E0E344|nr:homoserine O-succinyltransferase [Neobacillus sp. PS3-34]WML47768.1 homoserine O-succinyltransferase [Neobacillus sp. PS3-34]
MPINIPKLLPSREILEKENILVLDDDKVFQQNKRPISILILNLMPIKETAETQLLRLLGNTHHQVNITFLKTDSYESKNTSRDHLDLFYKTFADIKNNRFDGMIITGAPVELMEFEEVIYWPELTEIMDWAKKNVTSTLHICWGAQAALYYHYGIDKALLPQKCSGVYPHTLLDSREKLLSGFDDMFFAPHSRYTDVSIHEIERHQQLKLLASSEKAGALIISSTDGKNIMITGHLEYDADTLAWEYERDVEKGLNIHIPENYFPKNDPNLSPLNIWRSHGFLLFSNWLNYYVCE